MIMLKFILLKFSKLENRGRPSQNWAGMASFIFFGKNWAGGVLYYKSDVL